MRLSVQDVEDATFVSGWGEGLYGITSEGTLGARPTGPDGPTVDIHAVVEKLASEGLEGPVVLRFPQMLQQRVDRLNEAFRQALKDNGCDAKYRGVYPIKVNQRKEVVQVLAKAGKRWQYGLEVGSKAELLAALAMDPSKQSLLIVNGFKDKTFLEAACQATRLKEVVIVMDEIGELDHLLPLLEGMARPPAIGLRLKLRSRAPGKWALSGGERSKFGLTIPEVLHAVERLRSNGHLELLQMLHFHIGSQIGDIRRIVRGVREAARIHVELAKMGVPLRLLDVGGGLAVDYDGSGSSGPNSANYTMEEYASSVVATIKDVCDEAGTQMPDIITESGRAVASHHALLAVEVIRRVPGLEIAPDQAAHEDDPTPLANLYEVRAALGPKNAFEAFHDAIAHREDILNLFDLGHLPLEALGRAERLFRATLFDIRSILAGEDETESEEYAQACSLLGSKLVANFSLFQSLPDVWGVKQQFPVLPLQRLREPATDAATLADITCDSDGEVRRFIDAHGTRGDLPVHDLRAGEDYWLGIALVGAYQDTLGDYHNLFGETPEATVEVTEDGWTATRILDGSRVGDMLRWVRYDPATIRKRLRERIQRMAARGDLSQDEATEVSRRLADLLDSSTYLGR